MQYGALCLLPIVIIIVLCIVTKRGIASLLIGSIVSYIMINGINFFNPMMDGVYTSLVTEDAAYLLMLCLFLGSFSILLEKSGGAHAFAKFALKYLNTKKKSLIAVWLSGIIIFFDDYLNIFVNGGVYKKVTDANKVPREMLAYVVDSTAAPVCLLVPISVWAVFFATLMGEQTEIAYIGSGMDIYIKSIPFIFYASTTVVVVFMVMVGIIPKFGPMRKAFERADTGKVYSDESARLAINIESEDEDEKGSMWFFVLPVLALIAVAIWTGDALYGLIAGNVLQVVVYLAARKMNFKDICEYTVNGMASMMPLVIVTAVALIARDGFTQLEIAEYLIDVLAPHLSGTFFPAITFVFVATLAFVTVSCWGMVAVATPILIPLGVAVGADPILMVAAILSGAGFGSHACPYEDASIISAQITGITPIEHFSTQFPYALISAILSTILYGICGIIM